MKITFFSGSLMKHIRCSWGIKPTSTVFLAHLDVIKDSEQCLPYFCQVIDEVISLAAANQIIQCEAAGGENQFIRKKKIFFLTFT